jgi:hypothetical protein
MDRSCQLRPKAVIQVGEEEASYGRWLYPVRSLLIPDMPRHWFVTMHRIVCPIIWFSDRFGDADCAFKKASGSCITL